MQLFAASMEMLSPSQKEQVEHFRSGTSFSQPSFSSHHLSKRTSLHHGTIHHYPPGYHRAQSTQPFSYCGQQTMDHYQSNVSQYVPVDSMSNYNSLMNKQFPGLAAETRDGVLPPVNEITYGGLIDSSNKTRDLSNWTSFHGTLSENSIQHSDITMRRGQACSRDVEVFKYPSFHTALIDPVGDHTGQERNQQSRSMDEMFTSYLLSGKSIPRTQTDVFENRYVQQPVINNANFSGAESQVGQSRAQHAFHARPNSLALKLPHGSTSDERQMDMHNIPLSPAQQFLPPSPKTMTSTFPTNSSTLDSPLSLSMLLSPSPTYQSSCHGDFLNGPPTLSPQGTLKHSSQVDQCQGGSGSIRQLLNSPPPPVEHAWLVPKTSHFSGSQKCKTPEVHGNDLSLRNLPSPAVQSPFSSHLPKLTFNYAENDRKRHKSASCRSDSTYRSDLSLGARTPRSSGLLSSDSESERFGSPPPLYPSLGFPFLTRTSLPATPQNLQILDSFKYSFTDSSNGRSLGSPMTPCKEISLNSKFELEKQFPSNSTSNVADLKCEKPTSQAVPNIIGTSINFVSCGDTTSRTTSMIGLTSNDSVTWTVTGSNEGRLVTSKQNVGMVQNRDGHRLSPSDGKSVLTKQSEISVCRSVSPSYPATVVSTSSGQRNCRESEKPEIKLSRVMSPQEKDIAIHKSSEHYSSECQRAQPVSKSFPPNNEQCPPSLYDEIMVGTSTEKNGNICQEEVVEALADEHCSSAAPNPGKLSEIDIPEITKSDRYPSTDEVDSCSQGSCSSTGSPDFVKEDVDMESDDMDLGFGQKCVDEAYSQIFGSDTLPMEQGIKDVTMKNRKGGRDVFSDTKEKLRIRNDSCSQSPGAPIENDSKRKRKGEQVKKRKRKRKAKSKEFEVPNSDLQVTSSPKLLVKDKPQSKKGQRKQKPHVVWREVHHDRQTVHLDKKVNAKKTIVEENDRLKDTLTRPSDIDVPVSQQSRVPKPVSGDKILLLPGQKVGFLVPGARGIVNGVSVGGKSTETGEQKQRPESRCDISCPTSKTQSSNLLLIKSSSGEKSPVLAIPQVVVSKGSTSSNVCSPVSVSPTSPRLLLLRAPGQSERTCSKPTKLAPINLTSTVRPSNLVLVRSPDSTSKLYQSVLHVMPNSSNVAVKTNHLLQTSASKLVFVRTPPVTSSCHSKPSVLSQSVVQSSLHTKQTESTSKEVSGERKSNKTGCIETVRGNHVEIANAHIRPKEFADMRDSEHNWSREHADLTNTPVKSKESVELLSSGHNVWTRDQEGCTSDSDEKSPLSVNLFETLFQSTSKRSNDSHVKMNRLNTVGSDFVTFQSSLEQTILDSGRKYKNEENQSKNNILEKSMDKGVNSVRNFVLSNGIELIKDSFSESKKPLEEDKKCAKVQPNTRNASLILPPPIVQDDKIAGSAKNPIDLPKSVDKNEPQNPDYSFKANATDEETVDDSEGIKEEDRNLDIPVSNTNVSSEVKTQRQQRSVREERAIRYAMMQFEIMEKKRIRKANMQRRMNMKLKQKNQNKDFSTGCNAEKKENIGCPLLDTAFAVKEETNDSLTTANGGSSTECANRLQDLDMEKTKSVTEFKNSRRHTSKDPRSVFSNDDEKSTERLQGTSPIRFDEISGFKRNTTGVSRIKKSLTFRRSSKIRKLEKTKKRFEEKLEARRKKSLKENNDQSAVYNKSTSISVSKPTWSQFCGSNITDKKDSSTRLNKHETTSTLRNKSYLLVPSYNGFLDFSPIIVESRTRSQTTREDKERLEKPKLPVLVVEQLGEKKNEILVEDGKSIDERLAKESLLSTDRADAENRRDVKKLSYNRTTGETPLHKAARRGYADVLETCLLEGAEVNAKDNAGWTALHEACSKGHVDVVRLLLKYGADPNSCSESGVRPIHDAAEGRNLEVIRLLLSHKADPQLTTYSGVTTMDCLKSPGAKAFLKDFLIDRQLVNIDHESPNFVKGRWKFEGSSVVLENEDSTSNIFADTPRAFDSTITFETSRELPLPVYRLPVHEEGRVIGYRNYYILQDVLTRVKQPRNVFFKKHKLQFRTMPWSEFAAAVQQCEVTSVPPEPPCNSDSNEPIVELVHIGPYAAKKVFGFKTLSE